MTVLRPFGRALSAGLLLVMAGVGASCGSTTPSSSAPGAASSARAERGGRLFSAEEALGPTKTSAVQDGQYFTDLAKAGPRARYLRTGRRAMSRYAPF